MFTVRARLSCTLVVSAFLLAAAAFLTAAGTNATVTLHDGLATVVAKNATVAEILVEWSRAGGTTIVNGEKLNDARLTIELIDVPEKHALDEVLRPAAAYLAVERASAPAGGSRYDRILILASSSAPRAASAPASPAPRAASPPPIFPNYPPPPPAGVQRVIGADGQPVPDDQDGAPPPNRTAAPPGFYFGDAPPVPPAPVRNPPATTPSPSTPVGTPTPGMIVPPPQQQQQQQQRPPQPQR